jgi:hypothetical protein
MADGLCLLALHVLMHLLLPVVAAAAADGAPMVGQAVAVAVAVYARSPCQQLHQAVHSLLPWVVVVFADRTEAITRSFSALMVQLPSSGQHQLWVAVTAVNLVCRPVTADLVVVQERTTARLLPARAPRAKALTVVQDEPTAVQLVVVEVPEAPVAQEPERTAVQLAVPLGLEFPAPSQELLCSMQQVVQATHTRHLVLRAVQAAPPLVQADRAGQVLVVAAVVAVQTKARGKRQVLAAVVLSSSVMQPLLQSTQQIVRCFSRAVRPARSQ